MKPRMGGPRRCCAFTPASCFNEAEAMKPRMGAQARLLEVRQPGFNEAEAMKPRMGGAQLDQLVDAAGASMRPRR